MAFKNIKNKLFEPRYIFTINRVNCIVFDIFLEISRSALSTPAVEKTRRKHTYLSHSIKNELTSNIARKVKMKITSKIIKNIIQFYLIIPQTTAIMSNYQ